MIRRLQVEGYRSLKRVDVALTPLHAFIGPNDSGKSTLLRALRFLVTRLLRLAPGPDHEPVTRLLAAVGQREVGWFVRTGHGVTVVGDHKDVGVSGVRLLRLEPDHLRAASSLIPEGQPLTITEQGGNLPAVYDAILSRGDDAYRHVADAVRKQFPTVKNLRLRAVSTSTKALEIELVDGTLVPAAKMSEGLLYYLAYACLQYLDPVSLLLIEEPENGLHPARIAEVVRMLRTISEAGTQVIMATHSPLVVNELRPDEVSIVTRTTERGTIVTPMAATPRFAERSKVFALGELWLSYADGELEKPLLDPDPA